MAKTLGEIARSYQGNNDQGDFEEYRNRKGKVLPGYNPTVGGSKAQYLSETPGESEQFLEQEKSDAEKQLEDDAELTEERTEEYDESLDRTNETISEELYTTTDEQEQIERVRRRNREQMLAMQERHERLRDKLDKAIAAEYQRRKDLYAIENEKKNTLDYAYKVYGDQADVEAIFDSASAAKREASPEVRTLSEQISFDIDNKLHDKDQVTVVTETGHVRIMDRELAEAMQLYTEKKNGNPMLEQAAAGYDEYRDTYSDTRVMERAEVAETDRFIHEDFEFTRDEEEKLAELQRLVSETDKQAAKFEDKTPQAMTPEEYAQYNRERRFKEYGYPDAGVNYDYQLTREGMYEWNGRPLPSAMSSPTMNRELQAEHEPQMDQPSA